MTSIAQREAGLMPLTGLSADDPAQEVVVLIGELLAGICGAYAVLVTMLGRERTRLCLGFHLDQQQDGSAMYVEAVVTRGRIIAMRKAAFAVLEGPALLARLAGVELPTGQVRILMMSTALTWTRPMSCSWRSSTR